MPGFDVRLQCLATQAPVVTTLHVDPGWSQSARAVCQVVTGSNSDGVQVSSLVTLGYPADCIAVSEPPQSAGLCLAFVVLALGRRVRAGRAGPRA